jgi:RNA methyltransferase, TrmH family
MRRNNPTPPSSFCSLREQVIELHVSLRDSNERDQTGLFVAYGARFLIKAIESNSEIISVMICPGVLTGPLREELTQRVKRAGIPTYFASPNELAPFSEECDIPSVSVVVRQHWQPLPECVRPNDLWIGIEHLRTPGNIGTLMRSAAAVGANGMMIFGPPRDRTDPFDPTTVRASMGAIFGIRLIRTSHHEFRRRRNRCLITVLGAAGEAETDYRSVSYRGPVMLMLGNERTGLSEAQRTTCDGFVKVPMVSGMDSLNVAMAGTVLLYEAFGQRHPVHRRGV